MRGTKCDCTTRRKIAVQESLRLLHFHLATMTKFPKPPIALHNLNPHDIRIGDTFVLIDAGGGTVDLILYTVLAVRDCDKIPRPNVYEIQI